MLLSVTHSPCLRLKILHPCADTKILDFAVCFNVKFILVKVEKRQKKLYVVEHFQAPVLLVRFSHLLYFKNCTWVKYKNGLLFNLKGTTLLVTILCLLIYYICSNLNRQSGLKTKNSSQTTKIQTQLCSELLCRVVEYLLNISFFLTVFIPYANETETQMFM